MLAAGEERGRDGDNVVAVLVDLAARPEADCEECALSRVSFW